MSLHFSVLILISYGELQWLVMGLVLAFQWATTLSSLSPEGDPTELKEKRQYGKDQL